MERTKSSARLITTELEFVYKGDCGRSFTLDTGETCQSSSRSGFFVELRPKIKVRPVNTEARVQYDKCGPTINVIVQQIIDHSDII